MSGKTSEKQLNHIKSYYSRNKEKILAQKKEYYQQNKERIKANSTSLKKRLAILEQENEYLKRTLIKYMYGHDLEDSYDSDKSQDHNEGEDIDDSLYYDDDTCYDENGMPTMGFLVFNG